MKSPDFWQNPQSLTATLLSPLGLVYQLVGRARRAVIKPYKASVPVICVGNIVAGGSGKTPTALALANLLIQKGAKPVFVSRGYGGHEKGPLRVDLARHTFRDVGDEALLLAHAAPCWIGRDRAKVLRAAEPEASHIILDDGLQNPTVAPSINLLVIDGETGLGNGKLIPAGPLRETLSDALPRIDAIVIVGDDRHGLAGKTDKPVFCAALDTRVPSSFSTELSYFAFAGIGRPDKFFASCRNAGLDVGNVLSFSDHHVFAPKELGDLAEHARKRGLHLITTAKDAVRLPPDFLNQVNVLPVELIFEDVQAVEGLLSGEA